MPKVMLRKDMAGKLTCYVAKQDLEGGVAAIEFDAADRWGGRLTLDDGSALYIDPMPRPELPIELRAKRAE